MADSVRQCGGKKGGEQEQRWYFHLAKLSLLMFDADRASAAPL